MSSQVNMSSNREEQYSPTRTQANGPHRDSKLELFGFDSLVNILGLKRYLFWFISIVVSHLCSIIFLFFLPSWIIYK